MKRVNIKCPYCGSRALLRPASVVYGPRAADPAAPYYVCARYPACDSYVAAHRDTRLPMGTLANGELRRKRIDAHRAFDRLWKSGLMTKKQAFLWLQVPTCWRTASGATPACPAGRGGAGAEGKGAERGGHRQALPHYPEQCGCVDFPGRAENQKRCRSKGEDAVNM